MIGNSDELIQTDSNPVSNTLPLELQLNGDNDPSPEMFRSAMQSDILGNSAEASPLMSPHLASPIASQQAIADSDTQMSMVTKAAGLHLSDNKPSTINTAQLRIFSTDTDEDHLESSRKVLKVDDGCDTSTILSQVDARSEGLTDPNFEFVKFGFGNKSDPIELSSSPTSRSNPNELICSLGGQVFFDELTQQSMAGSGPVITIAPSEKLTEPPLNCSFGSKGGGCELKVLDQPEEQHRARYQTEGSRGAVKDKTGQSHPRVQLVGYSQPVTLQVYIGSDNSKFKPHGFYQACKVSGKNATPCNEKDIEGTKVIEIQLEPTKDMIGLIDCVGILKLRNSDVQQRIGLSRSKKKSTKARMIFRVNIPQANGTYLTLQVASSQILCTQPTGIPEICRMSLESCSSEGGEDLFIIGKNFLKMTKVHFQEKTDDDKIKWEAEANIDNDYFNAAHMIVTIPPYKGTTVGDKVPVMVVVSCAGRASEGTKFTYTSTASNGIENAPSVGMLVNESLFPPSSSEPAIFNDPGGATNLTFKVEPNVMSPELPQVSEEVRVPMDTGDCPPSKISKISECVSPEAEKLAQEYIVQSSQKNNGASNMYTTEPLNVVKEVVDPPVGKLEHMDTEATPKDTQQTQRKASLNNVESSVNLNAVNDELQKLMSTISSDHHSENPSGTNTPISPAKPGDRFSESLQNSPFTSPEPQLANSIVGNSSHISQPQFNSPTQAPPPEIRQEIFAGENPRTPSFTVPQQIPVEQISNYPAVGNMNINSEVQTPDTTCNDPGAFMLGNTAASHNEQQNQLTNALINAENVIDSSNMHAFHVVTTKQDQNGPFVESGISQQPPFDNLLSSLSDLINVTQQSPFDGNTISLNHEMPPNVSVTDIPNRDAQMPIPLAVPDTEAVDNKTEYNIAGLLEDEFNVTTSTFQAVSSSPMMPEGPGVNYLVNAGGDCGVEMATSSSVGFASAANITPVQQTSPLTSQTGVTFIPTTEVVDHQPMHLQVQDSSAIQTNETSDSIATVEAVASNVPEPVQESSGNGSDQNLLKDVLKGLNELCGLLKQNQKSEKTDQDTNRTKESLMSALPDKSVQLMEVLQNQIKGENQANNVGGLLQNMLLQQQQQQQQQQQVEQRTNNAGPMIVTSSVNTRPSVQAENRPQVKVISAQPVVQSGAIQSGVQVITSNPHVVPQPLARRGITQVINRPNGQPFRLVIDQSKSNPSQGVQMANIANITALVQSSTAQKAVTVSSPPLTLLPLNNGQCQTLKFINTSGNQPIVIANPSSVSHPITIVRGSANSASSLPSTGEVNAIADTSESLNIKSHTILAQLLTGPTESLQTVSVAQSQPSQPESMDTSSSTQLGQH